MDVVVHPLIQVQLPALLGEVADADGLPPVHSAGVGEHLPGDQVQKGGLSRPVVPDDAHPVVPGHPVGEVADHRPATERLGHVVQLHRLAPQAAGQGGHLDGLIRFRAGLGLQGLVPGDTVLVFGSPGLGPPHDPLVLHPQDGLALPLGGLLHLLLLGFQLQVLGIVGLIMADVAVGELGDPVGHPLQKVPVVGDHDKTPGKFLQVPLQPEDHVAVQVVGGLVQDEHIRRVKEHRRQSHPLPLAAGEGTHPLVKISDSQPGEHGLGLILHEGAHVRGKIRENLLQHGGLRVHPWVLA